MEYTRKKRADNNIKKLKHTERFNNKESISKKIKKEKENQRKLFRIIKDEIKKVEQFRISIEGLQNLSELSIKSIHIKREKAIKRIGISTDELLENAKMIKKLEIQYSQLNGVKK